MLLDFGAIQPYPKHKRHKTAKVLTKGYSPIEQYSIKGVLGPWTDIYAVGASMRACLDGRKPMAAPDRAAKDTLIPAKKAFKNQYPESFLAAIDWAMQIDPEKRPQSVGDFKQVL